MDLVARVANLETDVREIKRDVGDLKRDVGELKVSVGRLIEAVAEIRGRLTNMPTTFQVLTGFIGIAIGLTGLVYAIARITAAG